MKHAQLEARRVKDPALEKQIVELREKVRAYELDVERVAAAGAAAAGIISLGKRAADGSVVRVDA